MVSGINNIYHKGEIILIEVKIFDFIDFDSIIALMEDFKEAHTDLNFKHDYSNTFIKWIWSMREDRERVILTAVENSQVVGLIIGEINENAPLLLPDKYGYIRVLVVGKAARGKGVGETLWKELKKWFLNNKITEIQLYTSIVNNGAETFWEKQGFRTFLKKKSISI